MPGVDIARGGGFGQLTSIFTRGTNSNHTLVLVDGVEVSDPSAFGGAFNFAHLTANNVARVEMIRGPQSAVWGSDAIGGVVNIITKRGRGPLRAFIEGEAGSYGTYRGAVGFSGGEEAIDYSLSASWFNTEGISAADTDFAGNGERDGYRSGSVASRVGLHFTEDFDTNLVVRYLNTQSDTDGGLGVAGDQIGREVDEEHWYLKVEPVLRLFDDQWEQRLSVTYTDISREDPLGFTPSFDGTRTRVGWHHTVTAVEQHTFSFGVESDRETYTDTGTHQQRAHLTSGYLQDHIAVVPETVFITLSGRVDHHDEFGSEWTWRVAPAWHLHETHTVLRGSYGTGFRAPSLPELYSAFGSPTLEPEESKGWDVGIDQSFFGEKLVVGATYFHNDIDQLVAGFPLANIGDATTQGVELSAVILPAENWSIRGSYTYLDTDDGAGGKLLRRADQQFSVDVSWDVVPEQVNLTLAAAYIGERADTDFSVFPGRPVTLDPYTLVTLAGRWRVDDNLEVFGRVENLLDDDYQEIYGAGEVGIGAYAGVRYTF